MGRMLSFETTYVCELGSHVSVHSWLVDPAVLSDRLRLHVYFRRSGAGDVWDASSVSLLFDVGSCGPAGSSLCIVTTFASSFFCYLYSLHLRLVTSLVSLCRLLHRGVRVVHTIDR
jgi:hypothetical protein